MIATDLASFCREAGLAPVSSGVSRQISRQSVASCKSGNFDFVKKTPRFRVDLMHPICIMRNSCSCDRMEENLELLRIGAGIAKGIKAAFRGGCRPFRAWNAVGDGTQGAALGWYVMPRWGGGRRAA